MIVFHGCVEIRGLDGVEKLLKTDLGLPGGLSSGSASSSRPKPEKAPPNLPNLTDGQVYTSLTALRGRLSVKDSKTNRTYIYHDGGGIQDHEDYFTKNSVGIFQFSPVVSEPIFMTTCYSRVEQDPDIKVQFYYNLLGADISFVDQSNAYLYIDKASGTETTQNFNIDNRAKDFDQTSVYQNGKNIMFFENGQFLSKFALKNDPSPSHVGFSYVTNRGKTFTSLIDNTYMVTGRMAWGFKEALLDSSSNKSKNIKSYEKLFNISLSGGVNQAKARTSILKNEVAEAKSGFQTIDLRYQITPQLPADTQYPVYINLSIALHTKQHREISKTLFGMGEGSVEAEMNYNYDKQYVISSPTDVISDVFAIEYMDSVVNSDMSRTITMYLLDDPDVNVYITGMKTS
jgi:hypothetical protein